MNKVLEFKNISRKFSLNDETLSILREVNFSIHEKEKIALIGNPFISMPASARAL